MIGVVALQVFIPSIRPWFENHPHRSKTATAIPKSNRQKIRISLPAPHVKTWALSQATLGYGSLHQARRLFLNTQLTKHMLPSQNIHVPTHSSRKILWQKAKYLVASGKKKRRSSWDRCTWWTFRSYRRELEAGRWTGWNRSILGVWTTVGFRRVLGHPKYLPER